MKRVSILVTAAMLILSFPPKAQAGPAMSFCSLVLRGITFGQMGAPSYLRGLNFGFNFWIKSSRGGRYSISTISPYGTVELDAWSTGVSLRVTSLLGDRALSKATLAMLKQRLPDLRVVEGPESGLSGADGAVPEWYEFHLLKSDSTPLDAYQKSARGLVELLAH